MGKCSNAFLGLQTRTLFYILPPGTSNPYIGPYGKNVSKCFFSETTWTVETKLPRNTLEGPLPVFYASPPGLQMPSQKLQILLKPNLHWMVLYLKVFCSDMKFKMAATTGLSLTLDPMGKMFQNASSLKPLGLQTRILLILHTQDID